MTTAPISFIFHSLVQAMYPVDFWVLEDFHYKFYVVEIEIDSTNLYDYFKRQKVFWK